MFINWYVCQWWTIVSVIFSAILKRFKILRTKWHRNPIRNFAINIWEEYRVKNKVPGWWKFKPCGFGNRHVVKNASDELVNSIFRTKETKKIIFQSTLNPQNTSNHTSHSFVMFSVSEAHGFFRGQFSKDCEPVLPLSISSTNSFRCLR